MIKRQKRNSRKRQQRKLTLQSLNQRALLAVIAVEPQGDDNPAALLAEAIDQANATAEADTIELAAANYDLATLNEPTLAIDSEISIVGTSPNSTTITGVPDSVAIRVNDAGDLSLSMTTVYADAMRNGAIVVDGSATLQHVAVIGRQHDNLAAIDTVSSASTIFASGKLNVTDSIITDSDGAAIFLNQPEGEGALQLTNTIISASRGLAVSGVSQNIAINESFIFNNRAGIFAGLSKGSFAVSGSTIVDNFRTQNEETESAPIRPLDFTGITILSMETTGDVDIAEDNIIINNTADPTQSNIAVIPAGLYPKSIGTNDQANESLAKVTVQTVDGRLDSDFDHEGVNVDLVADDDGFVVQSLGLGRSSVFWNSTTETFLVESTQRSVREDLQFSEELVAIEAGTVIGNGAQSTIDIPTLLRRADAPTLDLNAWQLLSIDNIESTSGANISLNRGVGPVLQYKSIAGFSGTDTLTITGRDYDGNVQQGTVTVNVIDKTSVVFNVAASDLNEKIDVAISTSGLGNVGSFDMEIKFDPNVVRLVDSKIGREFPFLQKVESSQTGLIDSSALGGFSKGNDLLTLNFERIGVGSAQIEVLHNGFKAHVNGQSLPLSSFEQRYYYLDQNDANRNGSVTASDALLMINQLAEGEAVDSGTSATTEGAGYDRDLDANGDGAITARDALRVINHLDDGNVGESEDVDVAHHNIFANGALDFLVVGETIPSFVGRPELPLDDGSPLAEVDLTPPTQQQIDSAIEIRVDDGGISLERQLSSIDDQVTYAVHASSLQIGFALDVILDTDENQTLPVDSQSPLTLAIFREDGTLIEGLPNKESNRIFFRAIDSKPDELVYFRVGTTSEEFLDYRLELIALN